MLRPAAAAAALALALAAPPRPSLADADAAHNAAEAWSRLFSSVSLPAAPGGAAARAREMQSLSGSTVAFAATTPIASGGSVSVSAQIDPNFVDSSAWTASFQASVYVALYTARAPGAAIDLNGSTPVRYQACAAAGPGFAATGAATFTFAPNNLHSGGYVAYLIAGGLASPAAAPKTDQQTWVAGGAKPWVSLTGLVGAGGTGVFPGTVLATSPAPLTFASPNEPTMVRVTPGAAAGRLRVTWNHQTGTTGGFVLFSPRADLSGASKVLAGPPTTLTTEDVCALGPAATTGFRDFGAQFTAELDVSGLAGATAFYRVGADGVDPFLAEAAPFRLVVPMLPGAFDGRPQLWLSWADQGVGYRDSSFPGRDYNNGVVALRTSDALAADIAAAGPAGMALQGLTVAGDATYADGYETVWEDYFSMMVNSTSSSPYLISGGNASTQCAAFDRGCQHPS